MINNVDMMKFKNTASTMVVTFDWKNGDKPILLIGKPTPSKEMDILSAFQNEEAVELYKKLISGGCMSKEQI